MGNLYQLTSPAGKSYIGISLKTTEARWAKHVEHAIGKRENGALYAALRKYGTESFQVKTLVVADDWEYLCKLEQKAILAFNTKSPNGYNITDGGEGVQGPRDAKTKAAISAAQKKRFENPEQRALMSEYARRAGKIQSERHAANRVDGLAPWQLVKRLHVPVEKQPRVPRVGLAPWQQRKLDSATRQGSVEHRLLLSRRTREGMSKPEVKAKVIASAQRRSADPEWRKKISVTKTGATVNHTVEGDAARLAGIKAAWADPVKKAARLEKNRVARAEKRASQNG